MKSVLYCQRAIKGQIIALWQFKKKIQVPGVEVINKLTAHIHG